MRNDNKQFWDVDDLLMSNQVVSCVTETELFSFDFSPKNNVIQYEDTIKEGNKLEIPLWLALLLRANNYVTIKQPKYLSDKFYNQLKADPTIVNFKKKNEYLYDCCKKLIPCLDEERRWHKCLAYSLYKRYLFLFQNSTDVNFENHSIINKVCVQEKCFYDLMMRNSRAFKFYLDNYTNNNNNLDELLNAKKMNVKRKKIT
jgi:hypothetical protein